MKYRLEWSQNWNDMDDWCETEQERCDYIKRTISDTLHDIRFKVIKCRKVRNNQHWTMVNGGARAIWLIANTFGGNVRCKLNGKTIRSDEISFSIAYSMGICGSCDLKRQLGRCGSLTFRHCKDCHDGIKKLIGCGNSFRSL
jgi:hypothetical protein